MNFVPTESSANDVGCDPSENGVDAGLADGLERANRENEALFSALLALTRWGLWFSQGQTAALHRINKTVARTLNAARVSVWLYRKDRSAIVCEDLYELADDRHSAGQFLMADEYPAYFRALEETETIAAEDACRDPRTSELSESYLKPLGITSMLDTPIMTGGELKGVMCIENVGPLRKWSFGEQGFAVSVANLVSLLITQCSLERSESHLRTIAESEPECVMVVSQDGMLIDINPAGLRMIDVEDADAVVGKCVTRFIHEDYVDVWADAHVGVCRGENRQVRFRMIGRNQQTRWVEAHSAHLPNENVDSSAVLSVVRDITDNKLAEEKLARLNRLYQMLSGTNEAIVRIKGKTRLYERVCQIAVGYGMFRMAAVVEVNAGTGRVRPIVHYGAEDGFFDEIVVNVLDSESSVGPMGIALRTGNHDVCNDIETDPRMAARREAAARYGFRSIASFPIKSGKRIIAALVLFAAEPEYFREDEVALLISVSENLSYAVESMSLANQRREAKEKLKEKSAMLTDAQRIGRTGSWSLEVEGQRFIWSEAACELFDISPTELAGDIEQFRGFFPPNNRSEVERHLEACVESGVPFDDCFPVVTAAGRRGWMRLIGEARKDAEGRIVRVKGVFQDVSGIKRAEEERDRLFNLSLDMLCVTGFDGKFEVANPAWIETTGWSASELIGKTWLDFVHPEDREMVVAASETMKSGRPVREVASRFRCWDGSYRWLSWSSHPVVESQQVFAVARDITEWKNNEIKLMENHRALQLLSRSHEALNRSSDEKELLNSVCSLAVEIGGYRMAWVGYADDDPNCSVIPMARAGDIHGYLDHIRVSWSEREKIGCGPIGRSIRSGRVVVCEDVFQDESFEPWRQQALIYGVRGVICLPLKEGSRTFGVLGLYSGSVVQTGSEEIQLLQDLADNLALWICNLAAQAERRRIRAALKEVAASVSGNWDKQFAGKMAARMAEALGAQAGYIVRLLPGEPAAGRIVASVVDGRLGESSVFFLKGTPFELLVDEDDLAVKIHAQERFPDAGAAFMSDAQACLGRRLRNSSGQTIGFLLAVFREPFNASDYARSALRIFALRVAAELERQEADAKLREQASLIDMAQDAIIVRDLQHRVLYWNKGAERLFGWTADEIMGRQVTETIDIDEERFNAAYEVTMIHGEWTGEIEKWSKNGDKRIVESHWSLVRDDDGQPKSILSINTDITERKKLEKQFLRAQRIESIGTLAGGIAHDLNNVLAPIMMSIDLLQNYVSDSNGRAILDLMAASARRGSDMVRQVLSFARGVEGQAVELHFSHVMGDIVRILEETFPKNIQIGIIQPPDLWPIVADPTQLHQVLINLCVNARDAMPDGGQIIIKAENLLVDEHYASINLDARCGPYLKIEIEDTGCGIDPEIIDKLFDPFFTTKEVGKGTGLGLSTSLAIVKSHGGFINVYSEPGMGACFRIYLPVRERVCDEPKLATESSFPRGRGETVMVVDDEAPIRLITQQTLEAFGYRVLLAADGSEAISTYVQHQHDIVVVLTDMMMPVMDGPSTIRVLRRLNPRLHIIAMSGIDADGKGVKAVRSGANAFLTKPYAADVLLKTIHDVLSEKRKAADSRNEAT